MLKFNDLFGWKFKETKEETSNNELAPFLPPAPVDGAYVASGSWYGRVNGYLNIDEKFESENDTIRRYREVSLYPEVDMAVTEIVNESINTDDDELPVDVVLDNLKLSDSIKNKISDEFKTILRKLKFNYDGQDIFKRWYVDGRLYFYIVIDPKNSKDGIKELRYIPPFYIKKVKQEEIKQGTLGVELLEDAQEFFLYARDLVNGQKGRKAASQGIKLAKDSVCYVPSGEFDETGENIISYLHKVIKPANKLRMVEDALVIYRLARAPERRVFYIDVGNLPKGKAEEYMETLQRKYKNKLTYDVTTGELKDSKNVMSMMEDFWLPRREGGRGTEITTLQGGQNLGDIEDVMYFKKKLYEALNVPIGRISTDQNQGMFDIGRVGTISRDEVKFSKFISKIRKRFSKLFFELLKTQLLLKGIITPEDWDDIKENIVFNFKSDVVFAEQKDAEIFKDRISTLQMADGYLGKYFSEKYIRRKILRQSEEEIKIMDEEIAEEKQKQLEDQQANGGPDDQSGDTPTDGTDSGQPDTQQSNDENGSWNKV